MTIVVDILMALAIGFGVAFLLSQPYGTWHRAFYPSDSEIQRFERAAEIAARARRLKLNGFRWLLLGLPLIGLRSLPGGAYEIAGGALAAIGFASIIASHFVIVGWRYPDGPHRR